MFKGRIWVVGGRTAPFVDYHLQTSYKTADVWYSYDGAIWAQQIDLSGDFFAENTDVVQPGDIAPFFPRFGHSLDVSQHFYLFPFFNLSSFYILNTTFHLE